jgi:hypothetical protein
MKMLLGVIDGILLPELFPRLCLSLVYGHPVFRSALFLLISAASCWFVVNCSGDGKFNPFKDESQTVLFEDPVRTAL